MKKIILGSCLFFMTGLAFADASGSTISLPNAGDLQPSSSLKIALDPLLKNTIYNVTCLVTPAGPKPVDMGFAIDAKGNEASFGKFSLNAKELPNDQGTLANGENTVSVSVAVSGNGSSVEMKNLNSDASLRVGNCVAKPITQQKAQVSQSKSLLGSSYFSAYNDTDKTVTIAVGNFIPTSYTIKPHDSKMVFVSSDNQNIHIKEVK